MGKKEYRDKWFAFMGVGAVGCGSGVVDDLSSWFYLMVLKFLEVGKSCVVFPRHRSLCILLQTVDATLGES